MIPSTCRRTLQRWKLATVCQVHMRLVADRHKAKVLHSWQGVVRKSWSARIFARKSGLRQCQKIFTLWRKATARCCRCRRILAIQRCRWMVKTCGKAIAAWRLRSAALAAMRCRIHGRCRLLLEITLTAWRQLCSQRLWGRMRLEMRAEHASMLRVFGDWKWQVKAELTLRCWAHDVRKLQFSWTAWRKLLLRLELGRCQAEEAVKQKEVNGRCSAFQQWKRLALQRKTAVTGECCRNSQFLRSSFYSWSQSVKISKFVLKLDVKLTSFLQRGVWRLWRHAIQIELTQRKVHKHLAEAFQLWRITSVSALQSLHLGESELEVSASTVVESGKDTEAPDDVNRTLSDLSGLTLTEGSPILPGLAFESSPEDLLKTYSQLIPHPASPKVKGISLEKLQELRVPSTFQGDRGASTPQASQASQASHFVFLPSPVRSRQLTPVSTPPDGSYSNMLTPPPWPVDALKAAGVERQSNQRERRWQSNILKTWLGVCLQKKKLSVEQTLQRSASSRHLRAWHLLRFVQIYHRNILFRRCFGQWRHLQKTYAVKIRSLEQRKCQHICRLSLHHWRDALQQIAASHQKSLHASVKQLLRGWHLRSRLSKWCQRLRSKQELRLLVSSCKVWKRRCDQQRRAQSIFDGRMSHLTAKTWMAWCDYRSSLMQCTERMTDALQQCIGSTLGRRAALQRWALQTRRSRDATHGAGQPAAAETFVQKRMRKVQLLAHLTQWKARWRRHLLQRLLICWRKVLLRRLVHEKLNMQRMQELITILDQWRLAVQVIKSFRLMMMRRGLQRWHSWRGSQEARHKVQKICRDVVQSSVLRHWSRLYLARRHCRCHGQKVGAMLAWAVAVKITRQQRFALHGSVLQWQDMTKQVKQKRRRQSLRAWRGVVVAVERQRSIVQHWRAVAIELRWQRLSDSFRSWQQYHSVFQKARDMKLISRIEALKESFVVWIQAVGRWRAKQHVEVICRQQRQHQMLSAWTWLHRASNLAQRGPARRRMVTCWALWQLGVAVSKIWKRDLHNAVNLWRAGLFVAQLQRQKRFFRAWHSCLRSRRRQEAHQRTMLLTWMAFLKETRRCRKSHSFAMWRASVKVTALERHRLVEVWRCWQHLLAKQRGIQRRRQQQRILFAWHETEPAEQPGVDARPGTTAEALTATEYPAEDCAVCFEVLGEACPVRKLSCGHSFHHACIAEWLLRRASCPLCKSDETPEEPGKELFQIDLSHQEMAQFVHELEDIFRAIHVGVSEDYAVAISGLAYNLCASLGYEDEDELEEALACPLVNFLEALPHFEVQWPSDSQAEPRALMRPEPPEDLKDPKCLTFTVSERHDLFRVLLQGAHAEVEIPEIEFSIRPKAERRVDTIYNLIASAVFHLGDHVQKNRRMGGSLSEDAMNKICETIEQLNILLDLEQPFTVKVKDPQGVSEFKPSNGVVTATWDLES
eukprot:symbB.v1.2.034783.t2/scaffold4552.1/size38125/3